MPKGQCADVSDGVSDGALLGLFGNDEKNNDEKQQPPSKKPKPN